MSAVTGVSEFYTSTSSCCFQLCYIFSFVRVVPIISMNPAVCTQSEYLETRGLVPPQSAVFHKTKYEC